MVDANSFSDGPAELQPTSLLEMAQKVHDDFVAKGKEEAEALTSDAKLKHDELISSAKEFHDITILEAESSAATIVEDAQLSAFSLISDAKIKSDSIINGVQDKKLQLEAAILKLQEFEATYRANLAALISGAQATLAVAEIAADEATRSEPDETEISAVEGVNFNEVIEAAVHSDAVLIGAVRDTETLADFGSDQTVVSADSDDSESDAGNAEEPAPDAENESEETVESTPETFDDVTDEEESNDDTVTEEVEETEPTVEETSSSAAPVNYDPLETKPEIDAATVASILGQSGLEKNETEPGIFITGRPGWGKTTPVVTPSVDEAEVDVEKKEEK